MTYKVTLKADAEQDLLDALAWYDQQRPGLGSELLAEVEVVLDRISENPYLHPVIHRDIRRALTGRFPYGVFFILEDDSIVVLAVLHAKRDPAHWQQRR
jgi:plasmid stabilization system protein ParE